MTALHHERDKHVNTNVIKNSCPITSVINIAERLKKARENLGLTQAQLAKKASVTQGTIANIENGIRKKPRELLKIAHALSVSPDWLESGRGQAQQVLEAKEKADTPFHKIHELKQALDTIKNALIEVDMAGRERLAPMFESFARSPGEVIQADILTVLAGQAAEKSVAIDNIAPPHLKAEGFFREAS